ncbi:hypothetical protein BC834DRAFT_909884 [Gloeopeniophorella convolvens]|nr:hypothetical protein BC834DRAFT_909884 [Gloeopeniophorella convolvens]
MAALVVRYVMLFFIVFMFVPIAIIWACMTSNTAAANRRAAATRIVYCAWQCRGPYLPRRVGAVLWASYQRNSTARDAAAAAADGKDGEGALGDMLGADLGIRDTGIIVKYMWIVGLYMNAVNYASSDYSSVRTAPR